ncbi:J domain-containing protein [Dyella sp. 2HG41-7]|uniref:J domain-containing protein n=1 Tax=Dyella sp. 2HG41-7 TaxID=2883239 RepID=UPI001F3FE0A0|nr:J domain-containing protein [Dyella sp. 2HG41-7]
MGNEVDFLDLYRQLRVGPDCDLNEFKQAYRRCVSRLHPDRKPPGYIGYSSPRGAQRLQQLNVQYEAAMAFQRLHGRLPGALPATSTATVAPPRATPSPHPPVRETISAARRTSSAPRRTNVKWLIPIAVVAIAFLFWGASAVAPSSDGANDNPTHDGDTSSVEAPATPTLALGMSTENVRAIEGNPVVIRDDVWEYGPSWVRFDHGSVVDWYSSPLHSLKAAQTRPSGARN